MNSIFPTYNSAITDVSDYDALCGLLGMLQGEEHAKSVATSLLTAFGSFVNVIDASVESLCHFGGISRSAAVGISIIRDLYRRFALSTVGTPKSVTDGLQLLPYLSAMLKLCPAEECVVVSIGKNGRILAVDRLTDNAPREVRISVRTIAECAVRNKASAIVLAHNHPSRDSTPSSADFCFTRSLVSLLSYLHIELLDHLIIAQKNCCSFRQNDALRLETPPSFKFLH